MEMRDRIMGRVAVDAEAGRVASVDFGDLVRKLILFEHVVLESEAVGEFPLLVRKF
jgi:hypothetical protein